MGLLQIDIALPRREFELRAQLSLGAETLALVGPSGAGKTSLLRAVAGLEAPRAGRVTFDQEVWFEAGRVNLAPEHRRVGYLPQDFGLFPHLDVARNVRFAGRRERPDLLAQLGVSHLARARPHELSGGERQRAALARALARDPKVLLLDEPFAALDAITRQQVREQLGAVLRSLALPALVVTHSFADAANLAHRVGVLDRGTVVQLGSAQELMREPATATVAALTGANLLVGIATPLARGSRVSLDGVGQLISAQRAEGDVAVAVAPWELEICDPGAGQLRDTVVRVTREHDRVVVRLNHFTVFTTDSAKEIVEGQQVGLQVAPEAVRLLSR